MQLILHLNARFQPKHRFELEDALQEIFQKENAGEITGGGTSLKENGEIESCDIEIDFEDSGKDLEWLVDLLNAIGIPKGSVLRGIEPPINVGTLEGLAIYMDGTGLAEEIYQSCDINYVIEQLEQAVSGIGHMYSYRELSEFTALYFYGTSFSVMKEKMHPFISSYPLCQNCRIEKIA
ncbi:MAG: hypothetical protein NC079_05340 [Clostridium sp.]|nr:hypothetical protein [Acetatifactor muris]MCM1528315.1 hypothetical protein [Bacteroides sp.]MCM1563016.1 hypothetical protein [Clostridium sp.]